MLLVYRFLFLQTEQLEGRRKKELEGGSRGPPVRGRGRGEEGARVEIWIRPSTQAANPSSQRGGSESSRDSEQDGELGSLSASDVRSCSSFRSLSLIHKCTSSLMRYLPFHERHRLCGQFVLQVFSLLVLRRLFSLDVYSSFCRCLSPPLWRTRYILCCSFFPSHSVCSLYLFLLTLIHSLCLFSCLFHSISLALISVQ